MINVVPDGDAGAIGGGGGGAIGQGMNGDNGQAIHARLHALEVGMMSMRDLFQQGLDRQMAL